MADSCKEEVDMRLKSLSGVVLVGLIGLAVLGSAKVTITSISAVKSLRNTMLYSSTSTMKQRSGSPCTLFRLNSLITQG